jgi:hypothetical protein
MWLDAADDGGLAWYCVEDGAFVVPLGSLTAR